MVSIPPGSSLGRYMVVAQLGRGGMATVFRCLDPNLDRYVAVKVLPSYYTEDPTFVPRFRQEAQTIARLNHPNILQIYDFGEDKGFTYIVSELVLGGNLQDRLAREPLPIDEVLDYMRPLAEALDYAHSQGIIHRDLKPANVLLDNDGRPILADFGLARMLESATRFTQAQQALGTPEYMAPEQAMGADADHRSDLYAFGIMMYQMLLGQTPFRADTPAATLMAHVHRPLPLPTAINPDLDPKLEATLLKALAKDPDDRFQSAKEMIQSLEIAAGRAAQVVSDLDMGATAVLDTSQLPGADLADMDEATLVIPTETEAPQPARTEAMPTATEAAARPAPAPPKPTEAALLPPAVKAEPKPSRFRRWLVAGSGAAAVIAVIAVFVFVVGQGGGEEPETQPAETSLAAAAPPEEAEPTAAPEPTTTVAEQVAALEKLTSRTQANVAKLRGVGADLEVNTEFTTRENLASITRGFFKRESLRQQVFEAEELYKALGLMAEEQELEDILVGIQTQQVSALFDDQAEKVYVISDAAKIGAKEEIAIAAAYMGGIQQKLFGISGLRQRAGEASADQLRAVDALIKGDVRQVALDGYINTYFSQQQYEEFKEPLPENKLLAAPDVVRKANAFPLQEGATFVSWLYDDGGWEGVNEAYQSPPITTEQVMHPEKYLEGEEPQRTVAPNIAAEMGKGWTEVSNDTMGEFLLRTYLEQHLNTTRAAEAAEGWGGDSYSLLVGPQNQRVFLSFIAWDTGPDAADFVNAYEVFVGIKNQGVEDFTSARTDTGRKWVTADETIILDQFHFAVLLIIADDEQTALRAGELLLQALTPPTP